MNLKRLMPCLSVALLMTAEPARCDETVQAGAASAKARWMSQRLLSADKPVASFLFNGRPSAEFIAGWSQTPVETSTLSNGRTQYVRKWTDLVSRLTVTVVAIDYADYPAVEWTAYLKNDGPTPTLIIENVCGIDADFGSGPNEPVLRTIRGDNRSASSYEPLEFKLGESATSFHPTGGRPTNDAWPFFNIDYGQEGILLAVGWPGQWQAEFARQKDAVAVRAGQEKVHLRLLPGEEIRTPLMAVLFWKGSDWIAGQNQWRRWIIAHNMPRPGNKLPAPFTAIWVPSLYTSAAECLTLLEDYVRLSSAKADYFWLDAGWYETETKNWFTATGVGTWKPDPVRYPRGVREVSDRVHSAGMKMILWFEPERVYRGSDLWVNHPDWLLHWNAEDKGKSDFRLLNLGNPAARLWLTEYISRFLTDQGVDLYRQDFNVDPLEAWRNGDDADRQGMTENLYVQGYLSYWDSLLRQHPGMLIDSCASGGRRNDLETLRRSVPLLRSDYQAVNVPWNDPGTTTSITTSVFDGNQGHTYGLSLWVPMFGTGDYADDIYSARSHLCPWTGVGTRLDRPDFAAFRRQFSDHHQVAKFFYGDFFPLTPYSKEQNVWMAWEFFRPAQKDGVIQAFRRENNEHLDVTLRLHGLEGSARYEFTDVDSGKKTELTGSELMDQGLPLYAPAPRTALILTFKEVQARP